MQKQKIFEEILNYSKSIFDDNEYNKVMAYIGDNMINDLRLFVADKIEYLEAISALNPYDAVLDGQISLANKLEDIVLDYYLETIQT